MRTFESSLAAIHRGACSRNAKKASPTSCLWKHSMGAGSACWTLRARSKPSFSSVTRAARSPSGLLPECLRSKLPTQSGKRRPGQSPSELFQALGGLARSFAGTAQPTLFMPNSGATATFASSRSWFRAVRPNRHDMEVDADRPIGCIRRACFPPVALTLDLTINQAGEHARHRVAWSIALAPVLAAAGMIAQFLVSGAMSGKIENEFHNRLSCALSIACCIAVGLLIHGSLQRIQRVSKAPAIDGDDDPRS